MGFDRQWLEDEGSEDSFGRSLWTIGATAAEARDPNMRRWALNLFNQVAPHSLELGSPRTWAFALLGAEAVLRQHRDHPIARPNHGVGQRHDQLVVAQDGADDHPADRERLIRRASLDLIQAQLTMATSKRCSPILAGPGRSSTP